MKKWTQAEDEFLREYYDAVGDFIGEHDLGRPKGSADRRVSVLKENGAWDALGRMRKAELDYHKCLQKGAAK